MNQHKHCYLSLKKQIKEHVERDQLRRPTKKQRDQLFVCSLITKLYRKSKLPPPQKKEDEEKSTKRKCTTIPSYNLYYLLRLQGVGCLPTVLPLRKLAVRCTVMQSKPSDLPTIRMIPRALITPSRPQKQRDPIPPPRPENNGTRSPAPAPKTIGPDPLPRSPSNPGPIPSPPLTAP
jgi:hypothetical protein